MERGRRGLILGRTLLGLAVAATVIGWSLAIAAPGYMGGSLTLGVDGGQSLGSVAVLLVGVVGPVVGLLRMWRLHRAYREPEVSPWRYRDVDGTTPH